MLPFMTVFGVELHDRAVLGRNLCSSDAEAAIDCCPAAEENVGIAFDDSGRKPGVVTTQVLPGATLQELSVVASAEGELFAERRWLVLIEAIEEITGSLLNPKDTKKQGNA